MPDIQKDVNKPRFSEMIRAKKSIGTGELSRKAEKVQFWKKTASDTVRMRVHGKGMFKTETEAAAYLISEKAFPAVRSENSGEDIFQGPLPAFPGAITRKRRLGREDAVRLRRMVNEFEVG